MLKEETMFQTPECIKKLSSYIATTKRKSIPFGILNLLSFLYQRHPRSLLTTLTGYSVSGQSDVFSVKSVASEKGEQYQFM